MRVVHNPDLAGALEGAAYLQSSAVEKLLEHVFISELLQAAAAQGRGFITVLRAETDTRGYDLVLECNGITRWVQLKASRRDDRTQNLNVGLTEQPSGCVVWLLYSVNERSRVEFRYRWLGGAPGERLITLGGVVAKHAKANAQGVKTFRPAIRKVSHGAFDKVATTEELLVRLFGEFGEFGETQAVAATTSSTTSSQPVISEVIGAKT